MVEMIILICAACMLCGILVIGTTFMLNEKGVEKQLNTGYILVGMFFIILGGLGIRTEYRHQALRS
jgi:hypothetical protein